MNIWMYKESEIGPDRKKRRRIIVKREHNEGSLHIIRNMTFKNKADAQAEVVRAFGEIGAYV